MSRKGRKKGGPVGLVRCHYEGKGCRSTLCEKKKRKGGKGVPASISDHEERKKRNDGNGHRTVDYPFRKKKGKGKGEKDLPALRRHEKGRKKM